MPPEQPPQQPPKPPAEAPKTEDEIRQQALQRAENAADEIRKLGLDVKVYELEALRTEKKQRRAELAERIAKICERAESFPYTGLVDGAYEKIKQAEADAADYPGYATPIDTLVERFKSHGMRIDLGDDPGDGSVWVVPADSTIVSIYGEDRVPAKHFNVTDDMDAELKTLLTLSKEYAALPKV
jgi:hypothetical protein